MAKAMGQAGQVGHSFSSALLILIQHFSVSYKQLAQELSAPLSHQRCVTLHRAGPLETAYDASSQSMHTQKALERCKIRESSPGSDLQTMCISSGSLHLGCPACWAPWRQRPRLARSPRSASVPKWARWSSLRPWQQLRRASSRCTGLTSSLSCLCVKAVKAARAAGAGSSMLVGHTLGLLPIA